MSRTLSLTIVSVLLAVSAATTLRAEPANSIGRYLGVGWSDGYHSHAACPPKRHVVRTILPGPPAARSAAPAKSIPWWMIPADNPENLPPPPDAAPSTSAPGASLFRQPGEGASVHAPASPPIMR